MKHSRDPGYQAGRSAKRPRADGGRNYDREPAKRGNDERSYANTGAVSNNAQKDMNPPNLWKQTGKADTFGGTLSYFSHC